MRQDKQETVTASEIGNWVYCPEAWRLDALGLPASNQPARDAGTARHEEIATVERSAQDHMAAGRFLVVALIILAGCLWLAYR